MPMKKTTTRKKVTHKKSTKKKVTKRKVAKKVTRKVASKKKISKKIAKKKVTKKKVAKKVTRKVASKKKISKKVTKKKVTKKKSVKKARTKKKVTKKIARKVASKKKTAKKKTIATGHFNSRIPGIDQIILTYKKKRKNEKYMGVTQVEHFRNILNTWKAELLSVVNKTVDQMKNESIHFADPNDRATQEEELALELRTRDRESKLINKINESLAMMDTGDYGFCKSCGVEIGLHRLEARATATLCIDCKTLNEIKERQ